MPGALDHLDAGVLADRLRQLRSQFRAQIGILGRPEDQRGAAQVAEVLTGAGQNLGRGSSVEPENRPAGAAVEVPPDLVRERCGQRTDIREAGQLPEAPLRSRSPWTARRAPASARRARPSASGSPGRSGTEAWTTRRSIRSGMCCARARPRPPPQSWTTREKRSSPASSRKASSQGTIALDRIVEVIGLRRARQSRAGRERPRRFAPGRGGHSQDAVGTPWR